MFFGLFRLVKCFADWNFSHWVHFGTPNHPGVGGFLLEIDICIGTFFTRLISGGLGDPSRTLSETIWDRFWPQIAPQKSIFGDFHDHVVKVWVQGALGRFSELSPESRFRFFRVGRGPGASRAVAGLQRGEVDKHQKHPW